MKHTVDTEFGGIPNGDKFVIPDTPQSEKDWRLLLVEFSKIFNTYILGKDYEFSDWHHGLRILYVYLYNTKFYDKDFISKIQAIIQGHENACFARFECYDSSLHLTGNFMVFSDTVVFDRLSEETGILTKLV